MSVVTRENQPDRHLLFVTVLLCGAGLVMVTSASVAFAYTQHESAFYYAERQGIWMALGFVALVFASVNIFGGFLVTQRMLSMYTKKKK